MSISDDDIFDAVLAMDAYNRNNNQGVLIGGVDDAAGTQIGDATIIAERNVPDESFYAIAYQYPDGRIVISYRGTDAIAEWPSDVATGWSVGAAITVANQAPLSIQFFEDVVNMQAGSGGDYNIANAPTAEQRAILGTITTTGHSLGGGLAGYVASLTQSDATVFDHMPFGMAAWVTYTSEIIGRLADDAGALALLGLTGATEALLPGLLTGVSQQLLMQAIQKVASDLSPPAIPEWDGVNGYYTQDEVNTYLRNGEAAAVIGGPVSLMGAVGAVLGAFANFTSVSQIALEASVTKTEVDTYGWTDKNPIDRHSQALLVTLLYGEKNGFTDWHNSVASNAVLTGLFNDNVADAVGLVKGNVDEDHTVTGGTGAVLTSDQMLRMIAYSAIDSGTTVFGDTALKALFDDADDLGAAITWGGGSMVASLSEGIGQILDQFAGQLAEGKVSEADPDGGPDDVTTGVLNFDENSRLLSIDLSDAKWEQTLDSKNYANDIFGRTTLIQNLTKDAALDKLDFDDMISWVWGQGNLNSVQAVNIHTSDAPQSVTLDDHSGGQISTDTLTIFGGGNDTITGSADNDMISGGNGDDVLKGMAGDNFLLGGDGNDTLIGGEGKDVLIGGSGYDTVDYSVESQTATHPGALHVYVNSDYTYVQEPGTQNEDRLYDIEKIVLTAKDDVVSVATLNPSGDSMAIDGGGHETDAGNFIDFNGINNGLLGQSNGIYIGNGGDVKAIGGVGDSNTADIQFSYSNFQTIRATDGNDQYDDSTTHNVKVDLGLGADTVISAGAGTEIDLGADNSVDTVNVSNLGDVKLDNFGKNDVLLYNGIQLRGGFQNLLSDQQYAEGLGGQIKYSLSGSNLAVTYVGQPAAEAPSQYANTLTLAGWGNSYGSLGQYIGNGGIFLATLTFEVSLLVDVPAGISVIAGQLEYLDAEKYLATGCLPGQSDPLVLDLNGDGFNLGLLSTTGTQFDLDSDLYKEPSGWVGSEDGILVRDLNGDGQINDAREMFGSTSDGFSQLATLDGNHDGVVNAADNGLADFNGDGVIDANDTFAELQVWQDLNQDGVVENGELKSLADDNIVGLNVNATAANQNINGNTITATSTYIRGDGTTGALGDATLAIDNMDTTYNGPAITISAAAAAEPELKGFGTLVSLRQALSVDSAGIALVDQTMAGFDVDHHDLSSLRADIRPLLQAWADGSPIRDASGTIISGAQENDAYQDIAIVRDNGKVFDYSWSSASGSLTVNGQPVALSTYQFVSGLQLSMSMPENPENLVTDWGTPVSTASVTLTVNGVDQTATKYIYANGESVIASDPDHTAQESSTLQTLIYGGFTSTDQQHHYTNDTIPASDIAFFERYYGETMPLNVKPTDADAAVNMTQAFLDLMDTTLNSLSVAVAVQSPTFAPIFGSLVYDQDTNSFHSGTDTQLEPVYANLFTLAQSQTDPVAWLQSWQPMLDVVISDFTRGGGLLNTDGFLAQNLIGAYEAANPSFDFATAVQGIGLNPDQFIYGTGDLTGTNDPDIFYIHGDGQTASGGDGLDNYIVGAHFGHSVINDYESADDAHSDDVVRFTSLNADDFTFTRDGEDLIATVNATGETLKIVGQFHGEWPGIDGEASLWADEGVAEMIFADGTTWEDIDMAQAVSHPDAASTTVVGTADNDYLDGGAGDDILQGGGDGDIYVFGRGYDHDTIQDTEDNPFRPAIDILEFKAGISENDLVFHRDGNSNDLTITINGDTADSLTIDGQFAATYTGVFGTLFSNQIEMFSFADGGSLTADQIDQKILDSLSTDGNDTIYGFSRDDTLIGGKGDDFLSGGNGNDTYIFNRGDGHDTIADQEGNILSGENDTLAFGAGIAVSDVVFTRDGDDLIATIADTGDSVRISGQYVFTETGVFGTRNFNLIENFTWADGTTKDWRSIMDDIVHASETSGNDHVVGTHFDDIIQGGTGDDLLEGGDGADTYIFNIGDGHDTVNDQVGNILANDGDTIAFGAGISPSDIHIERTGDSLQNAVLTYDSAGDTVTIDGQFSYTTINFRPNEVENITFADGTTWTADDLRHAYIAQQETSGNDVIDGFYTDDVIDGGAGNDILRGGDGSDTYRFEVGFGQDRIEEHVLNAAYYDNDQIVFGPGLSSSDATLTRDGDDLIIGFAGMSDTVTVAGDFTHVANYGGWEDIESVTFGDGVTWSDSDIRQKLVAQSETSGDDVITGFFTHDTFDGGAGNDVIWGEGGGDTFLFGHGSGQDVVHADIAVFGDAPDTLQFKADVAPADVLFARSGNDLVVSLAGTTDSMTVANFYGNENNQIEQFTFNDGTSYTIAQVEALAIANSGTTGADTIYGTTSADTIDGKGGNDVVHGAGGGDTMVFKSGYGHLEIDDTETGGTANILSLGTGIAPSDIRVATDATGDITLIVGTSGDQIKLDGMLSDATRGVQTIHFANGTTWGRADVLALVGIGTTGADSLYGTSGSDTFDGKGGTDYEKGNGGNDSFAYATGYGHLEIDQDNTTGAPAGVLNMSGIQSTQVSVSQDLSGNVVLTDGTTGDMVVIDKMLKSTSSDHYGVQSVTFADGVTWSTAELLTKAAIGTPTNDNLQGTSGADVIDGRGGNDYATGGGGNDTFVFNAGYEKLEISETDNNPSAHNILQLGAGINPSDVAVTGDRWGDITLTDKTTGDQVIIDYEMGATTTGLQEVHFDDGTVWTRQDLTNKELIGTTGADSIYGTGGADTIDGKGGTDYVTGKGGNDTFIFNAGYGHLDISNYDPASGAHNVLQMGSGITAANITVGADRYGDLLVNDGVSGDQITLEAELNDPTYGVQSVTFTDGTSLSRQDLITREMTGTTAADSIYGTAAGDTIDGKGGTDYVNGKGGNDTFVFKSGYGHLEIDETDSASGAHNVLQLGTGINPADIAISVDRYGDIVLADAATGDQIQLDGEANSATSGVQAITFANGTTWGRADLLSSHITGTTGNDTLHGTSAAEVFDGKGGSDYEDGKGGNDTFIFNSGYGHLEVYEYDTASGAHDVVQFGSGINAANVLVTADRYGDIMLSDGVTGDQVTLDSEFGGGYGVQAVVFSDGTTWTRQDLITKEMTGTTGANSIYGTSGADTIDGKGGNDYAQGGGGNDTFIFNSGYGHLEIFENDTASGANNVLHLNGVSSSAVVVSADRYGDLILSDGVSGDQITLDTELSSTTGGVQSVVFSDGTTWHRSDMILKEMTGTTSAESIYGTAGADTIDGKGGNDYVQGGGGNDSITYNSGYGHLEIFENDTASGANNVLHLGSGIAASAVVVTADRYGDFVLTDGTSGDQITLDSELSSTTAGVQSLVFADGTTWHRQDLITKELAGTSGADTIYGTSAADTITGQDGNDTVTAGDGNDTIDGGHGNDDLTGGNGADTFVFKAGFGLDKVEDFSSSQTDIIQFDSSLFADYSTMLAHAATVGSDTVITYDSTDVLTIKNVTLANLHATDFHFV